MSLGWVWKKNQKFGLSSHNEIPMKGRGVNVIIVVMKSSTLKSERELLLKVDSGNKPFYLSFLSYKDV